MISMGSLSRRAPADWPRSLTIGTSALSARSARPNSFHDYALKVSAPGVNVMLTRPSCGIWRVSRHPLGRIVMQSGTTGGATISDGTTQPGSFVFLMRSADDEMHSMSLNGWLVADNVVAAFPPGRPLALACQGPYKWASLSVPQDVLKEAGLSQADLHQLGTGPSIIKPSSAAARRLAVAVIEAIDLVRNKPVSSRVDRFSAVERDLLANLLAAVASSDLAIHAASRDSSSLDRINLRALAFIRSQDELDLNVEYLCRAINVAERSLLRGFHRFFGIGPTQYMKLRRLNRLHRELQACDGTTVTGTMTNCGVTEFGRFAGAYRALFGETPSATLKRRLAAANRMPAEAGTRARHPLVVASARGAQRGPLTAEHHAVL